MLSALASLEPLDGEGIVAAAHEGLRALQAKKTLRTFRVEAPGQLKPEQMRRLEQGIPLSDGVAKCESVADEGGEGTNHWYRIVLREGRNRVVRRLFEALGLTVSRLIRVRFGVVSLPPSLKRGQVNPLAAAEVKALLEWLETNAPATSRAPREDEAEQAPAA